MSSSGHSERIEGESLQSAQAKPYEVLSERILDESSAAKRKFYARFPGLEKSQEEQMTWLNPNNEEQRIAEIEGTVPSEWYLSMKVERDRLRDRVAELEAQLASVETSRQEGQDHGSVSADEDGPDLPRMR